MQNVDVSSEKFWAVEPDPDQDSPYVRDILNQAKRACTEPDDAANYLLRGLAAYEQAEDSKKSILLAELTRNLPDLKGEYGAKGPEPVYNKLFQMITNKITEPQRTQLINFGLDLVESEPHASSKIFLDNLYRQISSRIAYIAVADHHLFFDRLDKIMESSPSLATNLYVTFCCYMSQIVPISEERFRKGFAPHRYPKYLHDVETIYDLAHRNMETIVNQLRQSGNQTRLTELFDDHNRSTLEHIKGRSTNRAKLIAEAILTDLSNLSSSYNVQARLTLNLPLYRQSPSGNKANPT